MKKEDILLSLEGMPIIATVPDALFDEAISSPVELVILSNANILNLSERLETARKNGKFFLINLDMAEGLGRDKTAIEYLSRLGIDGIVSTKMQLIRLAKEKGLFTIQSFFALDSKGIGSIEGMLGNSAPDMIEILPGVIGKVIRRFSCGNIPIIAGGLIETKAEVTDALNNGAYAVSSGTKELWYI